MTLIEAIQARMKELGWSQADLARATGISQQNIRGILDGRRPVGVKTLLVLDLALRLGLDYSTCDWPGEKGRPR